MKGTLTFDVAPDDRANHRDQHNHGTAPHADKSRWGNEVKQVMIARRAAIVTPHGALRPFGKDRG